MTDDAFTKDKNFFYRELNHQQITKIRQRKKIPISLILHTYRVWKKTIGGSPENPHAIFPFDLFYGYRNLSGVHHPGREGELENIVDKTFF
jgi:hypothetical protein